MTNEPTETAARPADPVRPSDPDGPRLLPPATVIRRVLRWLLMILALYLVLALLWQAGPALTPFIAGAILAYLLLPIVNRLTRVMPRSAAILLAYVAGILLVVTFFNYVVPLIGDQIGQLIRRIPSVPELQKSMQDLFAWYTLNVPEEVRLQVETWLNGQLVTLQQSLGSLAQQIGGFLLDSVRRIFSTVGFVLGFLAVPFWLFYVLRDVDGGRRAVNRLLHPAVRADVWNVLGLVNKAFSGYIRGQLFLGLIIGTVCGVGLTILDLIGFRVNFILLLAIWAGITELIPFVGPVLGAIPAVIVAFGTGGLPSGLAVLVLYFAVQQLENQFLVPRVVGETVGIHPAVLMVLLIVAGQLYGIPGVVLAAPVSAAARDLFVYAYGRLGYRLERDETG